MVISLKCFAIRSEVSYNLGYVFRDYRKAAYAELSRVPNYLLGKRGELLINLLANKSFKDVRDNTNLIVDSGSLSRAARGLHKSYLGFIWRYK